MSAKESTAFIMASEIKTLLELCLDSFEALSVALFWAGESGGALKVKAWQSLARDFNAEAEINPGEGLIGWVLKNNQPLNVDQSQIEFRGLLYYHQPLEIRSFMAMPVAGGQGVLAVDSHQRYAFSDKSLKILSYYAHLAGTFVTPGSGRPFKDDQAPAAGQDVGPGGRLWARVEELLDRPSNDGGGIRAVLRLIREASGLEWVFLTGLLPGDPQNYYLLEALGPRDAALSDRWPLNAGLAGWVQTKGASLGLPRVKDQGTRSYVFSPEEGFKITAFYGWPLKYGGKLRGGLFLAGERPGPGEELSSQLRQLLPTLCLRLAVQGQLERLAYRIAELGRLDAQTGLPHRTYFLNRLGNLLELAQVRNEGVTLYILGLSGLGRFAQNNGQEAARELLQSICRNLLSLARPSWELGHVSYGILAMAAWTSELRAMEAAVAALGRRLADWPLENGPGRASLGFFPAMANCPNDATGPEGLLEEALMRLALNAQEEKDDSD